jgi:hypothetical protein
MAVMHAGGSRLTMADVGVCVLLQKNGLALQCTGSFDFQRTPGVPRWGYWPQAES